MDSLDALAFLSMVFLAGVLAGIVLEKHAAARKG